MKRLISVFVCAMMWACQDKGGLTSPSSFGPGGLTGSVASTTDPSPAPAGDTSPSDVDVVGVNRAGITCTADGLVATIFVPTSNGEAYVNVWQPEVNTEFVKKGPTNAAFNFGYREGTFTFRLAVEVSKGDGTVWQDDRAKCTLTFTAPPVPRSPNPPPIDLCPNIEGNQSEVPQGLVVDEAGNCVEPEPNCEQVWVVDQQAYDETIIDKEAWDEVVVDVAAYDEVVIDQAAYDEQVCTPGTPIITGFVYKLTGAEDDDRRKKACKATNDYSSYSPAGSFEESACIPGNGAVDSCVFLTDLGSTFFRAKSDGKKKVTFTSVPECNIVIEGEPICETISHPEVSHIVHHDAVTHIVSHEAETHVVHHDEVGHYVQVCEK